MTDTRDARSEREDKIDRQGLASALSVRMKEVTLEQGELARQAGISVSYLRHMQNGTGTSQFSYGLLSRVSLALQWPANHLSKIFYRLPDQDSITSSGAEILTQAVMAELQPYLAKIDAIDKHLSTVMDLIRHMDKRIDVALEMPTRRSE